MRSNAMRVWGFVCLASAACGGAPAAAPTAPSSAAMPAAVEAPKTVDEQVALGEKVFTKKCASCHGAGGQGSADDPAVVGKTALPLDPPAKARVRKAKFETALDVAAFVKGKMPGDAPGTLSDTEAYAVLAFDLKANGVKLDRLVDPTYAGSIRLH